MDTVRNGSPSEVVSCVVPFALGKDLDRTMVERLFRELVINDALVEYQITNNMGFSSTYVKVMYQIVVKTILLIVYFSVDQGPLIT
jgi:hypothetical protein